MILTLIYFKDTDENEDYDMTPEFLRERDTLLDDLEDFIKMDKII